MSLPVEIRETEMPGVLEIHTRPHCDARGAFVESYHRALWADAGFSEDFVQDNFSVSHKGVLRGMHYQLAAHGMGKLVRAAHGVIFDVLVDLRRGSPTFGRWLGRTLHAEDSLWIWAPVGFAHGLLALSDAACVCYKCTGYHAPEAERTVSYKDPQINIAWPMPPTVVSARDEAAPMLADAEYDFVYKP